MKYTLLIYGNEQAGAQMSEAEQEAGMVAYTAFGHDAAAQLHGGDALLTVLQQYYLYHATRADLLRRSEQPADARTANRCSTSLSASTGPLPEHRRARLPATPHRGDDRSIAVIAPHERSCRPLPLELVLCYNHRYFKRVEARPP